MFENIQVSLQFTAFFLCVNKLVEKNGPIGHMAKQKQAKYINIATSLVHSVITGLGAIYAFLATPALSHDLIHTDSEFGYKLAQLSLGYFIYDAFDYARINNFKLSAMAEMALHHLVVLACFGVSVSQRMFVGLTMAAMLMEVNSIFLHSRTLCLYSGLHDTKLYGCISVTNILTLIIFRLYVSVKLIKWFLVLDDPVVGQLLWVGIFGIFVIGIMNVFLLYRCFSSDFIKKHTIKSKQDHSA